MIRQIAEAHKLLQEVKDAHINIQWENEMKLRELEGIIKKKEKACDDLNASIFKVTQENIEKDKIIEALEEQVKQMNIKKDLEKRVADLEEQLEKNIFLLDDEGTPIKSFTLTGELTVMDKPAEEKLKVGKWYNTTDFTVEKLKELLPVGTKVVVEYKIYYEGINEEPPKETERCIVEEVIKGIPNQKTYIKVKDGVNYKEWFKIIEE